MQSSSNAVAEEKEVLLPPGQQFQITRILLVDKTQKKKDVEDPSKTYPKDDQSAKAYNNPNFTWEVELAHGSTAVAPGAAKKNK